MNTAILGLQGRFKTGLATLYCEYKFKCGYHIISLVSFPIIGVQKVSIEQFKKYLTHFADPDWKDTVWFADESNHVFPGRGFSDKEQTALVTPLWQDRKQNSDLIYTAHVKENPITKIQKGLTVRDIFDDSTGVDKILRDVTRLTIFPYYDSKTDTVQWYGHDYEEDLPFWGYLNSYASEHFGKWDTFDTVQ